MIKKGINLTDGEMGGLSEEELQKYREMISPTSSSPKEKKSKINKSSSKRTKKTDTEEKFVSEDEIETISIKEHQKKVDDLKKKIQSLEEKCNELKKEKKETTSELTKNKKLLTDITNKNKAFDKKNEKFAKENDELKKEIESLKKTPVTTTIIDDSEIKSLRKKNDKLENEGKKAKEIINSLEEQLSDAKTKISELENIINDTPANKNAKKTIGLITRISPTEFSSDLFMEGRYTVNLAKNGSSITFIKDITGRAICSNGVISLPLLAKYLPFSEKTSYDVIPKDDDVLSIML